RELDLKSLPYLTLPRPPVAPQNLIRARSLRPDMTVAKKTVPEAKKTRTSSASSVDASSCPDHSWSLRSCGRGFEEPQGLPPRAPPARSQTTIPSAPQTDVISLRPLIRRAESCFKLTVFHGLVVWKEPAGKEEAFAFSATPGASRSTS